MSALTATSADFGINQALALSGFSGKLVTIASLYPRKFVIHNRHKTAPGEGFWHDYVIEACPKGQDPTILIVNDAVENEYAGSPQGKRTYRQRAWTAQDIANDLVRQARSSLLATNPQFGPAVWICKGELPSKQEIDQNRNIQNLYFRALVQEARKFYAQNKFDFIGAQHVMAGEYLGIEAHENPWMHPEEEVPTKQCVFCRKDIHPLAIVCPFCQQTVDPIALRNQKKLLEKMAKEDKELEEAAAAL